MLAGVLENGEALAAGVLLRGRDPEIGDGSHGDSLYRQFDANPTSGLSKTPGLGLLVAALRLFT